MARGVGSGGRGSAARGRTVAAAATATFASNGPGDFAQRFCCSRHQCVDCCCGVQPCSCETAHGSGLLSVQICNCQAHHNAVAPASHDCSKQYGTGVDYIHHHSGFVAVCDQTSLARTNGKVRSGSSQRRSQSVSKSGAESGAVGLSELHAEISDQNAFFSRQERAAPIRSAPTTPADSSSGELSGVGSGSRGSRASKRIDDRLAQ